MVLQEQTLADISFDGTEVKHPKERQRELWKMLLLSLASSHAFFVLGGTNGGRMWVGVLCVFPNSSSSMRCRYSIISPWAYGPRIGFMWFLFRTCKNIINLLAKSVGKYYRIDIFTIALVTCRPRSWRHWPKLKSYASRSTSFILWLRNGRWT